MSRVCVCVVCVGVNKALELPKHKYATDLERDVKDSDLAAEEVSGGEHRQRVLVEWMACGIWLSFIPYTDMLARKHERAPGCSDVMPR